MPQLRGPLFLTTEIPDIGRRASVTGVGPPVQGYFGATLAGLQLAPGSELLLKDGPVTKDGYVWYEAYFPAGPEGNQVVPESAWVAAGPIGQDPTLIEIGPLRCPSVPISVALLGSMTELARRECLGDRPVEVHGVLEQCYHDGIRIYSAQPAWLGPSCGLYLTYELGTSVGVAIHLPPSMRLPRELSRGDLIRMVGHVNDPAAAQCQVVPTGEVQVTEAEIELAQQQVLLACRSAFVIRELEVTGHIDLANPFGF